MKISRRWLVGLVLMALAVGLLTFQDTRDDGERVESAGRVGPEITAHARGVTLTTTDSAGQITWEMSATEARYYERADLWMLDQPRWRLHDGAAPPWRGRADRGRSWADNQRADLDGNVVMQRESAEGVTILETPFLYLQVPEHYAETDRPVTLAGPDYQVDSIGARAWMREDRIELLENAEGRYVLDDT